MDEDPGDLQPEYLHGLSFQQTSHGIKFYLDRKNNSRVLVLCPRLEDWIIRVGRSCKMKMSDFHLPNRSQDLHKVLGKTSKPHDLVHDLVKQCFPKSSMLQALRTWLS